MPAMATNSQKARANNTEGTKTHKEGTDGQMAKGMRHSYPSASLMLKAIRKFPLIC